MERPYYHRRPIIAPEELTLYKITNPAVDAAVTASIVDNYEGVLITLSAGGSAQTIANPTDTIANKRFTVVNNDTSTHSIDINGYTLEPGEAQAWIWDGTAWCALEAFEGATNTTKLAVTDTIAVSTTFSVTSSGVNYTKSGDSGDLLASAALFQAAEYIEVMLNGVYMIKGSNITWQSQTSLQLDVIVDNGDEIIILS